MLVYIYIYICMYVCIYMCECVQVSLGILRVDIFSVAMNASTIRRRGLAIRSGS